MMARNNGSNQDRRGIVLILVIVVLMALLLIATPFAVSMRDHQVTVAMADSAGRAQDDIGSVINAVTGRLMRFGGCRGPRYGKHLRRFPDKDNRYAYTRLVYETADVIRSYGKDLLATRG